MIVAWRSTTGVDEATHRSRVAGPTMVVSTVIGEVWKATPSCAGTVVQSQPGSAAQALPLGGRLVAGRWLGSSTSEVLDPVFGADPVARDPPDPSR